MIEPSSPLASLKRGEQDQLDQALRTSAHQLEDKINLIILESGKEETERLKTFLSEYEQLSLQLNQPVQGEFLRWKQKLTEGESIFQIQKDLVSSRRRTQLVLQRQSQINQNPPQSLQHLLDLMKAQRLKQRISAINQNLKMPDNTTERMPISLSGLKIEWQPQNHQIKTIQRKKPIVHRNIKVNAFENPPPAEFIQQDTFTESFSSSPSEFSIFSQLSRRAVKRRIHSLQQACLETDSLEEWAIQKSVPLFNAVVNYTKGQSLLHFVINCHTNMEAQLGKVQLSHQIQFDSIVTQKKIAISFSIERKDYFAQKLASRPLLISIATGQSTEQLAVMLSPLQVIPFLPLSSQELSRRLTALSQFYQFSKKVPKCNLKRLTYFIARCPQMVRINDRGWGLAWKDVIVTVTLSRRHVKIKSRSGNEGKREGEAVAVYLANQIVKLNQFTLTE